MDEVKYTYDDIQLVPQYSEVKSRNDVNIETRLSRNFNLMIPFIASPMDTVCESRMAMKMMQLGGVGCVHRFMSIEDQAYQVELVEQYMVDNMDTLKETWKDNRIPIMAAIGATGDYIKRTEELLIAGANVLLIDVAHGHHIYVKQALEHILQIRKHYTDVKFDVIAGSISTYDAALDLVQWMADGLRVGQGGGCFTPNMEVKTCDGFKKIKDIQIGDMVYTHTGELKPVINKFEYDDYDEIYDIDGIEATGNHKFYVVHQSKADLVDDTNIHNYAEWIKAEDLTDEYFLIEL